MNALRAHETRAADTGVPETRNAWNGIAAGYDRFVTPTHYSIANEGLRRAELQPGMRFLDVAAGSGALSIPAARLGARVLATDLSPVMLERLEARARREGLTLETAAMDGHALELEDDTFDVAGSQFGVMLFPDMPRGIRELARVTRPGGRVLMTVYGPPDRVEFISFMVGAIQTVRPDFPGLPTDPPPLPFQLRDPERLRREMTDAGLKDVTVVTTAESLTFRPDGGLWAWLANSNPIVESVLSELDLSADEKLSLERTLDEMVRERARDKDATDLINPVNIGVGTK